MLGFFLILFIFLIVPAAEISAFITVGGEIGIAWTLIITVLTAVSGTYLLRRQGFSILQKIRNELEEERIPGNELVHGLMILLAGLLLLIPGFITDALGLLLFVPTIRQLLWFFIARRIVISSVKVKKSGQYDSRDGVIDLEEEEWEVRAEGTSSFKVEKNGSNSKKEIENKSN